MKMMHKLAALAAFAFGLMAAPAFATEPPPGPCGGNQCLPTQMMSIDGVGMAVGVGEVVGFGDEWAGRVDKMGGVDLNTTLNVATDGCVGGCGDFSATFTGHAWEKIETIGAAIGQTPGETVRVENMSVGQVGLGVNLGMGNISQ